MDNFKQFNEDFVGFKGKILSELNRIKNTVQKRTYFDGISDDCGFYANLDVSKTLIICFSGFKQNVAGVQPFEFFNTFSDCNAQTLFLKDPLKTWFLAGIPGFGDTVEDIVAKINTMKETFGIKRIITVGGSSGGFASLLFGSLLKADRAIALMPQTFVDPSLRGEKNITIYEKNVRSLYELAPNSAEQYGDIRANLISNVNSTTEYHVFYPDFTEDIIFAEYLHGVKNLYLYKAKYDKHSLGQFMKEHNILKPLIMSAMYDLDINHTIKSSFQTFFEEL